MIFFHLIGTCDHCRAYSFTRKTEKQRHISLFHRRQKIPKGPPREISFVCADASCGKVFNSAASLSRHKKSSGHKNTATKRRVLSTRKTAKRQLKEAIRQAEFDNSSSESEDDEQPSKCDAKPSCRIDADLDPKDPVWIQCHKCSDWFHIFCVNLTQEDVEKIANYLCSSCLK